MRIFALIGALLLPSSVLSQQAATLVADSVQLDGQDQLIASGNIEVIFDGNILRATRIVYNQSNDLLDLDGPITIQTADGMYLTANRATLDPQLENGILLGARIVLGQQLQLAANQIDRQEGRYSQLYRTTATSCQICGDGPPLWDIRAERVIHDEQAQQLYFDNATFRIRGVPVIWLPHMRLPDPTLDRATGLLIPDQRGSTLLGPGIALPYFVTLGDHRDITFTPYVSAETRTMEIIYRQAFANGDLRIIGAVSDDTLVEGNRSYVFAEGSFALQDDVQLTFDIEAVSDTPYLRDYDYSSKDRLDSAIGLLQVTDTALAQANFTYYQTLRDDEDNASLPPIVIDIGYEARQQTGFGGTLSYGISADSAYRYSTDDGADGRDVTRGGVWANWTRDWVADSGIIVTANSNLQVDYYLVYDDVAFEENDLRIVPATSVTLRWPWAATTAAGTSHIIEPVLQIATSQAFGGTPPNEDSTRNELDQGNLFGLSRFAGEDAVETGHRAAYALQWTGLGSNGRSATLTFGQVIRADTETDFTPSSGLDGTHSDWLIAGQYTTPDGFTFDGRALIDPEDGLTRAASLINWQNDELSLSAAYVWQDSDAQEDRADTVSEWTLEGDFQLNDIWAVSMDGRYDIVSDNPVSGGFGLEWRNECVTIDVSVSRRYTSSSTTEPTTTYSFGGSVSGFSAGRSGTGPAARCSN